MKRPIIEHIIRDRLALINNRLVAIDEFFGNGKESSYLKVVSMRMIIIMLINNAKTPKASGL